LQSVPSSSPSICHIRLSCSRITVCAALMSAFSSKPTCSNSCSSSLTIQSFLSSNKEHPFIYYTVVVLIQLFDNFSKLIDVHSVLLNKLDSVIDNIFF